MSEHESLLKQMDLRVKVLESWQAEARPQLARASSEAHLLMGERNARHLHQAANAVVSKGSDSVGHP
ncbi:hypothetical protein ACLEPN_42550 [Myxococcus sp. 1LA]